MSVEEFPTSLRRHFSHNVVCSPATFPLLASSLYFVSFALSRTKKSPKISLSPPFDIFKKKVCSKLALQSAGYCAAFTQSR